MSDINTEVIIPLAEAKLKDKVDLANGLLFFARRCFDKRWHDPAQAYFEKIIEVAVSDDTKAFCLLSLGQINERKGDFKSAIEWYGKAFSLKPGNDKDLWYFLNNNIGYCLNQVKRHEEALEYCRSAMEISAVRFNAHKNLGVALEGLGRYSEAAKCYVASSKLNPMDERALRHLEGMVAAHPEVVRKVRGLKTQIEALKKAAATAWQ